MSGRPGEASYLRGTEEIAQRDYDGADFFRYGGDDCCEFTDITLIFSGERITISYESKLPEGALDALREFTDCLNRWATDERLLERHSEDRQPRE